MLYKGQLKFANGRLDIFLSYHLKYGNDHRD